MVSRGSAPEKSRHGHNHILEPPRRRHQVALALGPSRRPQIPVDRGDRDTLLLAARLAGAAVADARSDHLGRRLLSRPPPYHAHRRRPLRPPRLLAAAPARRDDRESISSGKRVTTT